MANYKVTRLIRSQVRLVEGCTIDGIRFDPVAGLTSPQMLVSESMQAESYRDASKLFDRHLLPVVDAVSLVTGAALAPLGASTLIQKTRSPYVFVHAVRRRRSAHLTVAPSFHANLLDDCARVARRLAGNTHARYASNYLRQAALAEDLTASTFHTLQAAEALSSSPSNRTDHKRLRQLMGDELHEYFYCRDPVLGEKRRNALAHGRMIAEEGLGVRTKNLQERLLRETRQNVRSTATPSFSPLTGFVWYEPIGLFLKPIGDLPDTPTLFDLAMERHLHSASDPRWVGIDTQRRLQRRW